MTEKILQALQTQAEAAAYLIEIFATDRSTSYKRMHRSVFSRRPVFQTDWAEAYRKRQAFHALLNKLKRDGLVLQKEKRKGASWSITTSGIRRLAEIREKGAQRAKLPLPHYNGKESDMLIIVAFDVPEKERRKRHWLRAALVSLGFQKIQQSVWIGKKGIPAEFINDAREYAMLPYLQIFSVSRGGTLKRTY